MSVDVRVLYLVDCPGWPAAVERVEAASALAGVPVEVHRVHVVSLAQAHELGFIGSPTILLEGVDPFPHPDVGPAMACRLYPVPDGVANCPTVDQVAEALSQYAG